MDFPCLQNDYQKDHVDLLRSSFLHGTVKHLIPATLNSIDGARVLFVASFAVLSHNTAVEDPLLNYSDQAGLDVFELTWDKPLPIPIGYPFNTIFFRIVKTLQSRKNRIWIAHHHHFFRQSLCFFYR